MPIGSIISGVANMHNALVNTGLGIANTAMQFGQNIQNQENWENAFNYQKELNNIIMDREDNSVQRRAADLAKAGINPMLAGLGGASATPGGIINPLAQAAPQIPIGTGTINGDAVASAVEELAKRKAAEKAQQTEIDAELELQRREIEASSLSDERKYQAERGLENIKFINDLILQRMAANDAAEQARLDRDLQWRIATHKALRELFSNSEVPLLDNFWKIFIDNSDDFMKGDKLDFNKLKDKWNEFNQWRNNNLRDSLGYKKGSDGRYRNDKGEDWTESKYYKNYKDQYNEKGGGRNF